MEIGGAQELVNMLGAAKDDRTRKEALKALHAISHSGPNFNYTVITSIHYLSSSFILIIFGVECINCEQNIWIRVVLGLYSL